MLTVKLLQTTQKIEILGSESQVYKKWQSAAMIREIFNSNMETGRNGPESGVSLDCPGELTAMSLQRKIGEVRSGNRPRTSYPASKLSFLGKRSEPRAFSRDSLDSPK